MYILTIIIKIYNNFLNDFRYVIRELKMKKKDYLKHLAKIFERKIINEQDNLKDLEFDSLMGLDITTLNDEYFPDLKIDYEKIQKSKTIKDLIKLCGNKID